MPKGRRSNERRRNRRTAGRWTRSDEASTAVAERGHAKLQALFERSLTVQKKRRKESKKRLKKVRTNA